MASPAERYAAARRRTEDSKTELAQFADTVGFELDGFQLQACRALEAGRGVLVAAPTGAGKTVVGEFAAHLALRTGRKAFYTTPIKALSNQKYTELVERHGPGAVGLLTGDNSVNGEAPVVVMTTEVLRNMLYAGSSLLDGLGYVVMDEVHYLADRSRGAVWEEVIIHLPADVLVVSLSATVSNAEEFGAWLDTVRGDTEVVVSEHRPVPLWQHLAVGTRLYDLFTDPDGDPLEGDEGSLVPGAIVNPELVAMSRQQLRTDRLAGPGGRGRRRGQQRPGPGGSRPPGVGRPASRAQILDTLDAAGLLPAITFIFSRAGCDAAVEQCVAWGLRLTTPEEGRRIRAVAEERCAEIPSSDLAVLGYWEWLEGLERGLAAHHAGLLPVFKETVEHLFAAGLVKAVFATETLALGVNMPARSVVLERLVKWNGQTHVDVTPGEYTQLTGRAGRRGIDVEGHAVVLWSQQTDPEAVAGLASRRTFPLRSSFRPTYNMAVNLVEQVGRERARDILETSFAQFQADRAVVGQAQQIKNQQEALRGYQQAMTCHLGDFGEYFAIRQAITEREKDLSRSGAASRRSEARASVGNLSRGDVVKLPGGRRSTFGVVLDLVPGKGFDGPSPRILSQDRQVRTIDTDEFSGPVEPVTRVRIPKDFNWRSPQERRDLASSLRNALAEVGGGDVPRQRRTSTAAEDRELQALRERLRAHPCHGCSEREEHARWAVREEKLRRDTQGLQRKIEGRTGTIARTFDRVCDLLAELGYLSADGLSVTDEGRTLRRINAETDLLVAQCLRHGAWSGLSPADLAAAVSTLVHESRRDEGGRPDRIPRRAEAAIATTHRLWSDLTDREDHHKVPTTREPDPGLAWAVHRWASGHRLDEVLREADLAAGDFVRRCKQLVDLLDQVGAASTDPGVRSAARAGVDAVRRGVVAHTSLT
ncbi:ATP-dependent RNA helicase HelY [Kineococcus radiotolerans]|uniref:ATP-dependent RNA helicase HelY n=1 Tax=Kineococcus radiotolerans TaxID=131568 RepID=A0A7W4TII9_KINRA|nr:DEAD/DEAH box helicase [Kineococcus radiotolerans]MBB2899510.1 ATP-dependent RNA helicase HelY [Kineococcus radiotolerans]